MPVITVIEGELTPVQQIFGAGGLVLRAVAEPAHELRRASTVVPGGRRLRSGRSRSCGGRTSAAAQARTPAACRQGVGSRRRRMILREHILILRFCRLCTSEVLSMSVVAGRMRQFFGVENSARALAPHSGAAAPPEARQGAPISRIFNMPIRTIEITFYLADFGSGTPARRGFRHRAAVSSVLSKPGVLTRIGIRIRT